MAGSTVVVVGAGGSAEFGLPTGRQIFESLQRESKSPNVLNEEHSHFLSGPFAALMVEGPGVGYQKKFWNLQDSLDSSPSMSVDMYSYANPSLGDLAKMYTVWKILGSAYEYRQRKNGFGDVYYTPYLSYKWRKRY